MQFAIPEQETALNLCLRNNECHRHQQQRQQQAKVAAAVAAAVANEFNNNWDTLSNASSSSSSFSSSSASSTSSSPSSSASTSGSSASSTSSLSSASSFILTNQQLKQQQSSNNWSDVAEEIFEYQHQQQQHRNRHHAVQKRLLEQHLDLSVNSNSTNKQHVLHTRPLFFNHHHHLLNAINKSNSNSNNTNNNNNNIDHHQQPQHTKSSQNQNHNQNQNTIHIQQHNLQHRQQQHKLANHHLTLEHLHLNQEHEFGPVHKADSEDLQKIRSFIEQFKARRGALGLTQKQAAQCFRAYTDDRFAFSDNFVGHFEGFQFRPQTAMTIAGSLAEWLEFAENETRMGRQLRFMPGKVKETRKRKYEVIRIRDSAKRVLVEAFEKNRSPSTHELEQLSKKTNIPSRNIEIFFKNRRTSRQYHQ